MSGGEGQESEVEEALTEEPIEGEKKKRKKFVL